MVSVVTDSELELYAACADFLDSGDTTELDEVEDLPEDVEAALRLLRCVVARTFASYHDLFVKEYVLRGLF